MSLLNVQQYMRPQDIQAFQSAAQCYQIFLLLRRTNMASKKYIGIAGYVPKRLDCKAKTADADVDVPGFGREPTALNSIAEITEFDRAVFQGRQPFGKGAKGHQGVYYNL